MTAQRNPYFRQFRDHLLGSAPGKDEIVREIVEEVLTATGDVDVTQKVEPGIAIVESLKDDIERIIKKAVEKKGNLEVTAQGLVAGAFKTSRVVEQEAHATIGLLATYIVRSTAEAGGDLIAATRGLIIGVIDRAGDGKLNADAAASQAATDATYAAQKIGPEVERAVREAVKGNIRGIGITIYGQHPPPKDDRSADPKE